jgi:uncharacterized caspase-like protein
MPRNERDYAVVVGIDTYPKYPNLTALNGAVNDAQNFIDWLKSPSGGNMPGANIFPFLTAANGAGPRLSDIQDAFEDLVARSNGGEDAVGRRLYIFFSGHGVGTGVDDASLLTADHSRNADKYLVGRIYANYFKECGMFDEVLLFMDCCQDYDGNLADHAFHLRRFVDVGAAHQVRRCYGYATEFGRKAREKELEGRVQGIFSHAILKGLQGLAVDEQNCITAPQLERYVKAKVPQLRDAASDQMPDFKTDDFVIVAGVQAPRVRVEVFLTEPAKGFVVLGGAYRRLDVEVEEVDANTRAVRLIPDRNYMLGVPKPPNPDSWERTTLLALMDEEVTRVPL